MHELEEKATINDQAKKIRQLEARIEELEAAQKPATWPEDKGKALVEGTVSRYENVLYYQMMFLWSISKDDELTATQETLVNAMLVASEAFFSEQGVGAQCPDDIREIVKSDAAKALFVECGGSNDSLCTLIKCMSKLGGTRTNAEETVSCIAKYFTDKYRADISSAYHYVQDGYRGTRDLWLVVRTLRDFVAPDGAVLSSEVIIKQLKTESTSSNVTVGNNPNVLLSPPPGKQSSQDQSTRHDNSLSPL